MLNNKTENKQKVHNSINLHLFTKQAIIIKKSHLFTKQAIIIKKSQKGIWLQLK